MKEYGVESIEFTTNIGGETKTVAFDKNFKDKARKWLKANSRPKAGTEAKMSKKEFKDEVSQALDDAGIKYEKDIAIGAKPEPSGTASSTDTELQPQVITCPYCEGQDIECLSTEKITSQLTLFEGGAPKVQTKRKSQDSFICSDCGALAKLSWREAKDESEKPPKSVKITP